MKVNLFCSAQCSYLDIYISQKIRLCVVDLEGKFQTFLVWKFRSIILIFLLFFPNCCFYSKELTSLKFSFQINYTQPDFSWNINVQIATVCSRAARYLFQVLIFYWSLAIIDIWPFNTYSCTAKTRDRKIYQN